MFYIYSPQKRVFSGSLEELRRVEKVTAINPSIPALKANDFDERPTLSQDNEYKVCKNALKQYNQMLQKSESREAVYHAFEIMSQPVTCLHIAYTLQQAYDIFQQNPFQLMPVVNDENRLLASLSRRELYHTLLTTSDKTLALSATINDTFIHAHQQVISAAAVTDVRRISSVLVEYRLDAMPVVDDIGRVLGIVSRTDILKCVTTNPPLSLWC